MDFDDGVVLIMAFDIPSPAPRGVEIIEEFRGVDLNSSPTVVSKYRSPEAPNMMRDIPGKVRKRQGYEKLKHYDGQINGVFRLNDKIVIHAGDKLFLQNMEGDDTQLYEGMADTRSVGRQFNGKLFIFDGKKAICYGEFEKEGQTPAEGEEPEKEWKVVALEEKAYVPTIIISRKPTGGGTTLEPINLIGKKFKESFLGTADDKIYQMTTDNLDADKLQIRQLVKDGEWKDLKEGTDFSVDRKAGKVTFNTAPGESPVKGMDNVEITAAKTRKGYADKINKCNIMTLFGVNGAIDRMFVSGNPDFVNQDWYCQINDGFYFGDLWYSVLGQDGSAIVGYSVINDRLAAHKSEAEEGRNIILRKGELVEDKPTFPIIGSLIGRGALGKYGFGYLGSDPLFLTDLGVMAITAADITGEKYSQNRSFYINEALTAEEKLADAFAFVWRDFYLLSMGTGRVYLLDGLQKSYERNTPYSSYQYECYYWENVPARVMWEDVEGRLCFGTVGGDIFRFYDNVTSQKSYNDVGAPIKARWDIPDLSGDRFYENKTFRYFSVVLAAAIATRVEVWVERKGIWSLLFDSGAKACYFDFTYINWERINFSSDNTPRTIGKKVKVKKVDKARFSLRNEAYNEPFGIYKVALEYTESGKYKG